MYVDESGNGLTAADIMVRDFFPVACPDPCKRVIGLAVSTDRMAVIGSKHEAWHLHDCFTHVRSTGVPTSIHSTLEHAEQAS